MLDAACGIGTQSLALTRLGYHVTASDLSAGSVERARVEAARRGLAIDYSVADMRAAVGAHHERTFDVVIACDNSIPHLLSDEEILAALTQFHQCTAPGGLCLLSVRDYAAMPLGGVQIHGYGVRQEGDTRYVLFQVWEFESERQYTHSLYVVIDHGDGAPETRVMQSRYYAISIERLMQLMAHAGFSDIHRIDEQFFQPVLVGRTRAMST